ncbi:hypothetical protein [Amycolatopsis sp. NPDC051371]|uniref:hypothetical protein n=1 Tax=Amycolatopsis sp. NPDC051371 TaxID=3155800 RepID=UPI003429FF59
MDGRARRPVSARPTNRANPAGVEDRERAWALDPVAAALVLAVLWLLGRLAVHRWKRCS